MFILELSKTQWQLNQQKLEFNIQNINKIFKYKIFV